MAEAAFPDEPAAFGQDEDVFGDVPQAQQQAAQVQQNFEQDRSRRNYIASIAKGASTKQSAVRSGVTGNG